MPVVFHTRLVDTDTHTLWKILSDLAGYKDWLVLPAGRVTGVRITADAGVLTRSERRLEVESGQWFEERVTEASAPNFVAFQVLRDNTGKFASTYKDLTIGIKAVAASGGGVNVTMNARYSKATLIGRWTDFFGPRNWKRAFKRSLENLATLVSRQPRPELFTPAWRQPVSPPAPAIKEPPRPAEPEPLPPAAPADAFAAVERPAAREAEPAEVQPSRAELEEQLTLLRGLLVQTRKMDLPTADIEARIAEIETRLRG